MATLKKRSFGKTGLEVTEIGLGLWAIGSGWGPVEDDASRAAIRLAIDEGVNFYDTADVYGSGHSEWILGESIQNDRDKIFIASKIGWVGYDGKRNCSAYDSVAKLMAGVESSLKRIGTDHLDLIQCHVHYPEPNTQVFVEGFHRLKEQGKVRAFGVSTSDLAHLKTFNADGKCDALQVDYSILNRTAEADMLPYCKEHTIAVIVRGPLAMGILAGKYNADSKFPDDDFRRAWIRDPDQNAQFLKDIESVKRLKPLATDRTLAQLALSFVLANPAVTTVIPGVRNPKQAKANILAGTLAPLSGKVLAQIDTIVKPAGGRKIWPA